MIPWRSKVRRIVVTLEMNSNTPDPNSDEATAYHEAGHAIVALVLGRPVEKVTIRENSLRLGQVQMSNRRGTPIKDEVEVQALILLAGVVSEARRTGVYNWRGAQQDMQGVRRLARFRASTEKQEERSNGLPDAKAVIVKNRNGATFHAMNFKFDGETFRFLEVREMPNNGYSY